MTREVRALGTVEHRASEDGAPRIAGYAAVFNSQADIGGYFREQIAPGAFARSIQSDDVRALWNHDSNYVLGRKSNRSLTLREDEKGLYFEVVPPETTWAADLVTSIKRGDVSQMSFGFVVRKQQWDETGKITVRTLLDVELLEVSPVTFPVYDDTSAAVRSLENWRRENAPPVRPGGAAVIRTRMLMRLGLKTRSIRG